MIKVTVLYPNNIDPKFDKNYYTNQHSQLLVNLLGDAIIASDINFGIAGTTTKRPAPFIVISNLVFESMETFQQSFYANSKTILADLPNFTNVEPLVQISEVV